MRHIAKHAEPGTVRETREAPTTDLTTTASARTAFEQIDKSAVRAALTAEQEGLCAFCMRRADTRMNEEGRPVMRVAHRVPVAVDPSRALDWQNFLGSCDGVLAASGPARTCDVAQRNTALTVDPTNKASVSNVRFERRSHRSGLFVTSDDPAVQKDLSETLALNEGDLPALRQAAWDGFLRAFKTANPNKYGKAEQRAYYARWRKERGTQAPIFLGVIEHRLAL